MKKQINKSKLIAALISAAALPSMSNATNPWINEAGSSSLTLSYGQQTADEFFAGDQEMMLPADLELDTTALGFSYGLSDQLTLDIDVAYSNSDFPVNPVVSPNGGLSGLNDSRIGIRYGFYNNETTVITAGAAVIIDGGYETGALSSIGDGENGVEASIAAGTVLESGLGFSGGVGYRYRDNEVPNELFADVQASFSFNEYLGAYLGYELVRSSGDLDIGAPGFSPRRFQEVDEDYDVLSAGLSVQFTPNWGVGASYGRVLDGRNTSKNDYWNAAVTYSF